MSEQETTGKFAKALLLANFCVWAYFWIAFAQASYPFRPNPLGHPSGTGYTFWGHSIALVESPFIYLFFRVVFYVEFPSFLIVTLATRVLSPHMVLNWFFAGISGEGWLLVGIMLLSFFQWYLVGWGVQKLLHRWSNRSNAAQGPSPPTSSTLP